MTRSRRWDFLAALLALLASGCGYSTAPADQVVFEFTFSTGPDGWVGGASDYPAGREADLGFVGDWRGLPAPYADRNGLYQYGVNISDDLFMYFVRRLPGLEPGAPYRAAFEVDLVSNVGRDCAIGVGASVWIKAGAAGFEPRPVLQPNGDYRMNLDKGEQSNEGTQAHILGGLRNGLPGCTGVPYNLVTLRSTRGLDVSSASDGSVWVIVGSESGFESPHHAYYARVRVALTPVSLGPGY